MYQALYRKYRPSSFNDVLGQKSIIDTLTNAIKNNTLSHAYLFSGPRGTGKTSVAKLIAKIVNCEQSSKDGPCNKCVSCTQNNSDIIEIDAASNNGVDEIRELKNKINLVPTYGKYKIYIIDEVHMLTISAFNALLKTLEEPPNFVIFILATTEPQKIPTTIISRCQKFDFKRIDEESIVKKLKEISKKEKIKTDDEALIEISRISDGGMRDAINLLDQASSYASEKITLEDIHQMNGTVSQAEIETFFSKFFENDLEYALNKIQEYNDNGKNLIKLAQEFVYYLKNTLIYIKCPKYFQNNHIKTIIYEQTAKKTEESVIVNLIREINLTVNEMKNSGNPKLNFELIFIKNISFVPTLEITKNEIDSNKEAEKKIHDNCFKENYSSKNILLESGEILNFKSIRINNTLANFDKNICLKLKKDIESIKRMLIEPKYSKYVSIILDGSIRAASEENIIFMYKSESDVEIFNESILIIEEIIELCLSKKYKVIAVISEEWEKIKTEFNGKTKHYTYIKEPKKSPPVNLQSNEIENLFENIIEYK
ncbi:MAG: DNA polymerase III subunit gamma/tau [Bacilli bacterium]